MKKTTGSYSSLGRAPTFLSLRAWWYLHEKCISGIDDMQKTVFWMSFGCLLDVFWMSFGCVLDVFWMSFGCLLDVFWMSFGCLLDVFLDVFWMSFWMCFGCGLEQIYCKFTVFILFDNRFQKDSDIVSDIFRIETCHFPLTKHKPT